MGMVRCRVFFPGSLCFSSSFGNCVPCWLDEDLKCSRIMNTTLYKTNNSSLHFAMIHITHEGFLSPWFTFHETNGNDSPLKNAGKETYKLGSEFGAVRPIFRGEVCWEGKLSEFLVATCSIQNSLWSSIKNWLIEIGICLDESFLTCLKFNNLPLKEILVETSLSFWILTVKLQGSKPYTTGREFFASPQPTMCWSKPGETSPDRFCFY